MQCIDVALYGTCCMLACVSAYVYQSTSVREVEIFVNCHFKHLNFHIVKITSEQISCYRVFVNSIIFNQLIEENVNLCSQVTSLNCSGPLIYDAFCCMAQDALLSVAWSVCPLLTTVYFGRTAEVIKLPF